MINYQNFAPEKYAYNNDNDNVSDIILNKLFHNLYFMPYLNVIEIIEYMKSATHF